MGKCVFASQTMRAVRFGCGARPALVVTHWSNTQRRAERSPERLESRWQLDYGGFRERGSAARIARARNAGDREQRGSFDRVDLQALVCFLPLVAA